MHVILLSIVHFHFGHMLWISSERNLLVIRVLEKKLNIYLFYGTCYDLDEGVFEPGKISM